MCSSAVRFITISGRIARCMAGELVTCLTRIGLWQRIFRYENTKKGGSQGLVSKKQKVFFKTDIVFFTANDVFFTSDSGEVMAYQVV